jgi:hypothetical protein
MESPIKNNISPEKSNETFKDVKEEPSVEYLLIIPAANEPEMIPKPCTERKNIIATTMVFSQQCCIVPGNTQHIVAHSMGPLLL